jgi:hypothetical protein
MSARSSATPRLAACFAALALCACQTPEGRASGAQPELEPTAAVEPTGPVMRSYDAPPGRAEELAGVLQRVLTSGPDVAPIGTARAIDGDRVLVVAPVGIQEGVEQLCTQLQQQGHVPQRTVEISYWLVTAKKAEQTDVSAVPELASALQEIATATGPATFTLFERATLSSTLNAEAKTYGVRAEFRQVAAAHEGGIVADIEIDLLGTHGAIDTRISVTPGKTVVIGQNGLEGDDARLFYVLRAELVDAA